MHPFKSGATSAKITFYVASLFLGKLRYFLIELS